ncbi:MAG: hypothetical protein ABIT20_22055 [Gemmatimonadaceae bacterium]
MSTKPRAVPQRIAWFEGSRLAHRDLADAVEHEARMLELHVRTVHDTWGIAFGLTTTLSKDLRSVVVQAGLAYTCKGASVFLITPTTIAAPLPTLAGVTFDLLLVKARQLVNCDSPALDCHYGRMPMRATLMWVAVGTKQHCECDVPDDGVHLGRFTRSGAGILAGPDISFRRKVRGLVHPHIASAVTRAGALTWNAGTADLIAQVDTSAGAFTTTPVYLAFIATPTTWPKGFAAPFVNVSAATPTSFTLHLTFATLPPALAPIFAMMAQINALTFSWVGVESAIGCSDALALITAVLTPIGVTP